MFKEVGKELKFWAKISAILTTVGFGLIGIFVAALVKAPSVTYISFIALFALIGYVIGRFAAIWLYAYGEIVDCAVEIMKKIREKDVHEI